MQKSVMLCYYRQRLRPFKEDLLRDMASITLIVQSNCKVSGSFHHLQAGEITWLMRSEKDLQTCSAVEKNSCCKAVCWAEK